MTDLHCHLLPSVDDGVQTEEESLKILKEYKANGIDTVVFTPHINHPTVKTDIETIKEKYKLFKPKAEALGIKTYLGSELYLQPNKKDFIPLFNTFALIEMPTDTFPVYFMNTVFDLQLDAYEIIIAHVERYKWLLEKPEMIAKLKDMGVYFQVNLNALENKQAEYYRKNNLIDFISTDNHGSKRKQTDLSAYKKYPEIIEKMKKILSPYL
jgi:protein-tyrosine phosphatase